jgi:hypothetical protein
MNMGTGANVVAVGMPNSFHDARGDRSGLDSPSFPATETILQVRSCIRMQALVLLG